MININQETHASRCSAVPAKLCDWLVLTSVFYPPFLPLVDYIHVSAPLASPGMSDHETNKERDEVRPTWRRGGAG